MNPVFDWSTEQNLHREPLKLSNSSLSSRFEIESRLWREMPSPLSHHPSDNSSTTFENTLSLISPLYKINNARDLTKLLNIFFYQIFI